MAQAALQWMYLITRKPYTPLKDHKLEGYLRVPSLFIKSPDPFPKIIPIIEHLLSEHPNWGKVDTK